MAGSAFAVIEWFFLGVTASKWIGLPQYASAMRHLQDESRNWGIAVLVLQAVALALSLFSRTHQQEVLPAPRAPLTYVFEKNRWVELLESRLIRAALCILGTIGLIILFAVLAYLWGLLLRA